MFCKKLYNYKFDSPGYSIDYIFRNKEYSMHLKNNFSLKFTCLSRDKKPYFKTMHIFIEKYLGKYKTINNFARKVKLVYYIINLYMLRITYEKCE